MIINQLLNDPTEAEIAGCTIVNKKILVRVDNPVRKRMKSHDNRKGNP